MPPSPDDLIARRALRRLGADLCGRYSILRLIGVGGMAAVYAGVHRNGHAVAIKILHERLSADPEIERLFRREAQLANKVGHPGVVPVIDDDVADDGCVFLVMPLLQGETLRARAERQGGRLPVEEVVVAAQAVLRILGAAHAKKIVHRDVKPENLFLTCEGEIRVLDFGIGRFFEASEPSSATRSGRALGTPAFMAPEQALGRVRDVDGRTDLWALGATMFSLLSGRFVHEAESPTEIAVLAATKPARPLAEVAPEVPASIVNVVDKALSFSKEGRWSDVAAMEQALLSACRDAIGKEPSALAIVPPPRVDGIDFDGQDTVAPKREDNAQGDRHSSDVGSDPDQDFGPATTRTTTGVASAPARGNARAKRGRFLRGAAGGGLLLTVLAIGSAIEFQRRSVGEATGRAPAPVPVASDLAAVLDGPVPEAALADYRAGIQLWRDASRSDAARRFATAAKSAPAFAAAHLWTILCVSYVDSRIREYYSSARLYRATLTDLQRETLDALGPAMEDPPDLATTASSLATLVNRYPESQDLKIILASQYMRLDDAVRGLPLVDQLIAAPRPSPEAFYLRAELMSLDNNLAGMRVALRSCTDLAADANDCLTDAWVTEANEGNCRALEPICRRAIASHPEMPSPYNCLVDAIYSTGGSIDAVRSAREEQYKRTLESQRDRKKARDRVFVAIAEGRLSDGAASCVEWQRLTDADDNAGHERGEPYDWRTTLAAELGDTESASRAAAEYSAAAKSWPVADDEDYDATGVFLRSLAGDANADERAAVRERVRAVAARPSYGWRARAWYNAFVLTSWTHSEAMTAVDNMPAHALNGPQYRTATDDYLFGRVFLLAGQRNRAKVFFERAASTCRMREDFYKMKATLELARLSEERRDIACGLYGTILGHWSHSPNAATTIDARRRYDELNCKSIRE